MVDDTEGTVEEIGLTFTFIETADQTRLVIPNEKLASDSIVNFTIRDPEKIAEITVQVPLETDLDALLEELRAETDGDVFLSSLEDKAVFTLRERAASVAEAERVEQDLRLRAHRRLRAAGVFK
jgi:small-conductance mechanosensitive channel